MEGKQKQDTVLYLLELKIFQKRDMELEQELILSLLLQ